MQLWQLISCVYIERGTYVVEEKLYSYYTGASIRLFILQMVFYITILITGYYGVKNRKNNINIIRIKNNNENIIIVGMYLIIFLLLLNVFISGNSIINKNITRFNFWSGYAKFGFLFPLQIIQYEIQLINGIIMSTATNKRRKIISIILFCLTILYYLLIGNLFTQLLYITFFFVLPTLIKVKNKYNKIINIKYLSIIILIAALLIASKLNFFKNNPQTYAGIVDTPIQSLLYRALGLQGHTWWGTDRLKQLNMIDSKEQLSNEIKAFMNPEEYKEKAGIWYLMSEIAPYEVNNAYLLGGGTFNCGYPAINIAVFGYWGALIFQIINGFIFTKVALYLYKIIFTQQYIKIFITSIVYYYMYEYFFMGNISTFGNKVPLISMILLVLIIIYEKIFIKNKIVIRRKKSKFII